jgi:hypothetical protein
LAVNTPGAYFSRLSNSGGRAARIGLYISRQPGWLARFALSAGLFTFIAVLAVLVIPALLIAILIFFAAAAILSLHSRLRALFVRPGTLLARSDGRRNVRVITRD